MGEKALSATTSKIRCISIFYGPLTLPKNHRPRSYMQPVNTRILRPFWSKSVEKNQCYRQKIFKNFKIRVFFEILQPPWPKIKNRSTSVHAPLQYTNFEGSLKKIGSETKKFMHLQYVYKWDHQICKCIKFFVSQLIFFNDPSKFVYCKGACTKVARFLIVGLGGREISKNTLILTFWGFFAYNTGFSQPIYFKKGVKCVY